MSNSRIVLLLLIGVCVFQVAQIILDVVTKTHGLAQDSEARMQIEKVCFKVKNFPGFCIDFEDVNGMLARC